MDIRTIRKRIKAYKDSFGFDIADISNLQTKKDCKTTIMSHRWWLENASGEALRGVDNFISELGLDFVDID